MFSNRVQVAQVCRVLTAGIGSRAFFTQKGPTEAAQAAKASSSLAGGDRALLELAFWLWDGGKSPRLSQLVELLDRTRLRLVGSLLIALADGAQAIERWIKANGGPVGDA